MPKKLVLFAIIACAVVSFFLFDLNQYLSVAALKSGLANFESLKASHPVLTIGGFLGAYIAVTALSLPGATILTLAAGALFGLLWGTVLVSLASTTGATLAFLGARYLFRDGVQKKFSQRLKKINEGVQKDGAFYLLTLRLVPVVPFFIINLVMGLSPLPVRTFFAASMVGMLPGTIVYVNAGTQIAQINSLSDVLSPGLIASLALLAIFPLLARTIIQFIKARKVYKNWTRPKKFDRNLIVIGAGSGGLVSAYIASALKAKVTLVEANEMGGDCLNTGCVPSKTLIKSAKIAHYIREAEHFGMSVSNYEVRFHHVMQRVFGAIAQIEPHDSVERYTKLGVDVLQGYARLLDPWTVEIERPGGEKTALTARNIVLATGAKATVPVLPGLSEVDYVTSDTLWERFATLDSAPKRLVILGGGPIGCELAQAFARLGSEVTQVQLGDQLMPREDSDVALFAKQTLESDGVRVLLQCQALRCKRTENHTQQLICAYQSEEIALDFDFLVLAVGRSARLQGYGLETLGIATDRTLQTNEFLQTQYPNILACGDVVGPYQFTHVASHQAWYAVVNALFGGLKRFAVDYRVIPWTTFIDPEIARVGLNEKEARAQGVEFELTRFNFEELDRAIAEGENRGFVQVLTAPGSDKILGATIVGSHASEMLAEFVLAMKHNLGLKKILGTIHSYPTWTEATKYTAGEWRRAHAPQTVLRWLERYFQSRL